MKILKAKKDHLNKQIFKISDLTYIKSSDSLKELLNGEDMNDPIEVIKHIVSDKPRMGGAGMPYIEKQYSVYKGSQRIKAALQLGYTHIEGIIVNE